ncbi:MAG: acyl-CoA thioesterase [Gemmatimonadales bacterium]
MLSPDAGSISDIEHRVNYSETDQMGFVYHANYLVWLDMARTEHLRRTGVTYKVMEEQGVFLAVTDAHIRYRQPARYDDLVRVRCWVRDLASRRVIFGYAVERAATDELLATAETALIALDRRHALARIPEHVIALLHSTPDPVRR